MTGPDLPPAPPEQDVPRTPAGLIAALKRDAHLTSEEIGDVIDTRPETAAALDPSMARLLEMTINVERLDRTRREQADVAGQCARHLERLADFIDTRVHLEGAALPADLSAEVFAQGVLAETWWAALRPGDLRTLAGTLTAPHAPQDTPESVHAAMEAAQATGERPSQVPQAEEQARYDVLSAGHEYREALRAARRLPELRAAFHGAQARLSAALDGAP